MYELVILSLLGRHPLHGYLIARIINDIIGPVAKLSNATLYPLLTKLESTGLILAAPVDNATPLHDRQARTFTITEAGQARLHQLMMDTTANQGDYSRLFRYKVAYLYLVSVQERLHLINHYIHYCQTHILYYTAEAEDLLFEHQRAGHLAVDAAFLEYTQEMMLHQVGQWQGEMAWATRLRDREHARTEKETV